MDRILYFTRDAVFVNQGWHTVPSSTKNQRYELHSKNSIFDDFQLGDRPVYLTKLVFSQIIFWTQFYNQQQSTDYAKFSIMSKYLFVIDILGVFSIQTVLILVPYNWMRNIIQIFKQLSDMEDSGKSENKKQNIQYMRFQKIYMQILKVYLIIRVFFLTLFIPFVILGYQEPESIIVKIMMVLLLSEAGFVVIILVLGVYAVKKNKKLAEIVEQSEIDIMTNQYIVLIIGAIIRFVMDTIFVYLNFKKLSQNQKCYINYVKEQNRYLRIVNVVLQATLTHFLPIFMLLRLFNVEMKDVDLSQSLLAAQQFTQDPK